MSKIKEFYYKSKRKNNEMLYNARKNVTLIKQNKNMFAILSGNTTVLFNKNKDFSEIKEIYMGYEGSKKGGMIMP
ncbi:MAG TPA: hypothetical protein VKN74_00565, partial [Candidatus Mcinerneyibacterium sp.]|nr:hypothetical protein [Candidatus Mcinerneyibacterium sp.]